METKLLKHFSLRATMLVALAFAAFTGAWADSETITFSNLSLTNGQQYLSLEGSAFSLAFGDGANDGKYYNTGTAIRVYGGGHMTVSSDNTITAINLTFGSGEGSNAISTDVGTYSNGSWTGSATSVTFNVGGTSGHRRIASVTVTYVVKSDAVISVKEEGANDAATTFNIKEGDDITFVGTSTSGATVSFEIESSTIEDPTDYELDGNTLTALSAGVIVLKATCPETGTYKAAETTITVNVQAAELSEPTFNVSNQSLSAGETYRISATTDGTLSYVSSNPLVASVDAEGLVTANAVGSATITVNATEGVLYEAGSADFTVTVNAPSAQNTKPADVETVVFYEGFTGTDGNTNNGNFSNTAGNGSNVKYDNEGWEKAGDGSVYGAGDAIKLGSGSKAATVTTPSIDVVSGKTYTLTFKAAPWNAESTTMNLTVTGGQISGLGTNAMTTQTWNDYSATITATASTMTIKFAASENRFFLDEVKLTTMATPTITATIAASGYGTVCSQYPMNIASDKFKAYVVTNVSGTTVTFTEVETETVAGGVPLILFGEAGTYELESDASTNVPEGNMLVGTLAPTYVKQVVAGKTNFGLSGGEFKKITSGVVPGNKAYLPVALDGDVKSFSIVFEEATGINLVETVTPADNAIYNLAGQRVSRAQKGIFIQNGKKFIVK